MLFGRSRIRPYERAVGVGAICIVLALCLKQYLVSWSHDLKARLSLPRETKARIGSFFFCGFYNKHCIRGERETRGKHVTHGAKGLRHFRASRIVLTRSRLLCLYDFHNRRRSFFYGLRFFCLPPRPDIGRHEKSRSARGEYNHHQKKNLFCIHGITDKLVFFFIRSFPRSVYSAKSYFPARRAFTRSVSFKYCLRSRTEVGVISKYSSSAMTSRPRSIVSANGGIRVIASSEPLERMLVNCFPFVGFTHIFSPLDVFPI